MLNVQGQPRAVAQLQRSLFAGRLASTWMFAGPVGVGKFTLAVALAKTVMCDRQVRRHNHEPGVEGGSLVALLPEGFELTLPCGACESCRAVESGNHPDLHIITKELIRFHDKGGKSKGTTLSIDVIRGEITGDTAAGKEAKIAKRAFRGRGKFFIIEEADLMDAPAQNALLKTLEEPPAETYVILLTASPQDLLSTIRSRAQLVMFTTLPGRVLVERLIGAGLAADEAKLLARLARGSLGRALTWADDIRVIEQKNTAAAERAEKKAARSGAADDDEAGGTDRFTRGGILAWARELGAALDALVAGRAGASDIAAVIARFAAEYSGLYLLRDKLASADRAKRDGIQLLMGMVAEWFSDRLRQGLGTAIEDGALLPGDTGALDYGLVPQLIAAARDAEWQIDMNANDKILLAATTTRWEQLLHAR